MDFLKLLWFLARNVRFHEVGNVPTIKLRGLNLALVDDGDVRVWADRDLRLNARFLLNQCEADFDPQAYLEEHESAIHQAHEDIENHGCHATPRGEWQAAREQLQVTFLANSLED